MEIWATLAEVKRYSSYNSGDSEGREIAGHPGNLDGPQPVFSGTGQGFDFYIRDLGVIEVDLDSFDDTLCSVEGESDRLDFWWGLSFGRDRRRGESGELKNDPGSMYDLPFFVVARLFTPGIRIGLGFARV